MHFSTLSLGLLTLLAPVLAQPANPNHPQAFEQPNGIDLGNIVCGGVCVADPDALSCGHKEFRPQYGCFMCCISDDDLDRLDEDTAQWDEVDKEGEV